MAATKCACTDAQGQRFKAKIDPQSLALVKFKPKMLQDSDAHQAPTNPKGRG